MADQERNLTMKNRKLLPLMNMLRLNIYVKNCIIKVKQNILLLDYQMFMTQNSKKEDF